MQSSGTDFSKLLESSVEKINETEAYSKNKTISNLDSLSILPRQGSIDSVASSIDLNKHCETRLEPVKVAETHSTGGVSLNCYISLISAGGNIYKLLFIVFICICTLVMTTSVDYWISYW